MVANLVPQDTVNPLYSKHYIDLANNFISHHTLWEEVNPHDPRMTSPRGLVTHTTGGWEVVFKRNAGTFKDL